MLKKKKAKSERSFNRFVNLILHTIGVDTLFQILLLLPDAPEDYIYRLYCIIEKATRIKKKLSLRYELFLRSPSYLFAFRSNQLQRAMQIYFV